MEIGNRIQYYKKRPTASLYFKMGAFDFNFYQNDRQPYTVIVIIPRRSRRDIVLASSVRPSVLPSVHTFCLSGTISQYLLVRFDSFLVQMISTSISHKFGQNRPLNT